MPTVLNGYLVLSQVSEPNPNWTQPGQLLAVKRTRSSIDKTVVSFQRYDPVTPTQVDNTNIFFSMLATFLANVFDMAERMVI